MTAWSVGAASRPRAAVQVGVSGEQSAETPTAADAPTVDKLLNWIPGDVIAAYMALVLALQGADAKGVEPTGLGWLIAAIVAAGVLTFLGGFASSGDLDADAWRELLLKSVLLSPVAFALWSLVLPGSWWQSIDKIASNAPVVAIAAGLGAAAFGLLAQGIVVRVNPPD